MLILLLHLSLSLSLSLFCLPGAIAAQQSRLGKRCSGLRAVCEGCADHNVSDVRVWTFGARGLNLSLHGLSLSLSLSVLILSLAQA